MHGGSIFADDDADLVGIDLHSDRGLRLGRGGRGLGRAFVGFRSGGSRRGGGNFLGLGRSRRLLLLGLFLLLLSGLASHGPPVVRTRGRAGGAGLGIDLLLHFLGQRRVVGRVGSTGSSRSVCGGGGGGGRCCSVTGAVAAIVGGLILLLALPLRLASGRRRRGSLGLGLGRGLRLELGLGLGSLGSWSRRRRRFGLGFFLLLALISATAATATSSCRRRWGSRFGLGLGSSSGRRSLLLGVLGRTGGRRNQKQSGRQNSHAGGGGQCNRRLVAAQERIQDAAILALVAVVIRHGTVCNGMVGAVQGRYLTQRHKMCRYPSSRSSVHRQISWRRTDSLHVARKDSFEGRE